MPQEWSASQQQYKEFLAKHLDEETEMRISEEQRALSENIRGIEKMSEDEKMLLERLKALNTAHQEASNELAMALSHDPFAEAESVAGAGADTGAGGSAVHGVRDDGSLLSVWGGNALPKCSLDLVQRRFGTRVQAQNRKGIRHCGNSNGRAALCSVAAYNVPASYPL